MMMRPKLMAAMVGIAASTLAACGGGPSSVVNLGEASCYAPYKYVPISSAQSSAVSQISTLQSVSQACLAAGESIQRTSAERANAYFHAGRALVELAREQEKTHGADTGFSNNNARTNYESAVDALTKATFHNPGLSEAWITLARAQAGLGSDAGYYSALVDPNGPLNRVPQTISLLGLNATYARAEILQRRSQTPFAEPGDRAEAVRLLGSVWTQLGSLPPYDENRSGTPETNLLSRTDLRTQTEASITNVAGSMADMALTSTPQTLELARLQRARDALVTATQINRTDANALEQLGQIQLYLAGFQGPTASPDFECSALRADAQLASAAKNSFDSAIANGAGASALRGRACANQAIGGVNNLSASVIDFRQLIGLPPTPQVNTVGQAGQVRCEPGLSMPASGDTAARILQQDLRIDLGRAYKDLASAQRIAASVRGREEIPADAKDNLGRSICAFESAIQGGAAQTGPVQQTRTARIRFDIASAYLALDDTTQARQALDAAIADDPNFAAAHFELAKLYLDVRNNWLSPNYNAGYESLKRVEAILSRENENAAGNLVSAETSYYLSKLQTMDGRKGSNTWTDVINYADLALAQYPPELETPWEIEQQTCLARISAGGDYVLNDNSARDRCSLNTKRNEPEGLLLRGMYYLKRARALTGLGAKQDNWDSAMLAFEDGLAFIEAPNSTVDANSLLAEKLRMGKLITQYCFGQTSTFQRGVDQSRPYYNAAVVFMENHGLDRCR